MQCTMKTPSTPPRSKSRPDSPDTVALNRSRVVRQRSGTSPTPQKAVDEKASYTNERLDKLLTIFLEIGFEKDFKQQSYTFAHAFGSMLQILAAFAYVTGEIVDPDTKKRLSEEDFKDMYQTFTALKSSPYFEELAFKAGIELVDEAQAATAKTPTPVSASVTPERAQRSTKTTGVMFDILGLTSSLQSLTIEGTESTFQSKVRQNFGLDFQQ